jgi:hypothetical protein
MSNAIARCVVIAVALLPAPTLADPIKLKMAYFSSDPEPGYVSVMQPFAEAVNKAAGGHHRDSSLSGGALGRIISRRNRC